MDLWRLSFCSLTTTTTGASVVPVLLVVVANGSAVMICASMMVDEREPRKLCLGYEVEKEKKICVCVKQSYIFSIHIFCSISVSLSLHITSDGWTLNSWFCPIWMVRICAPCSLSVNIIRKSTWVSNGVLATATTTTQFVSKNTEGDIIRLAKFAKREFVW